MKTSICKAWKAGVCQRTTAECCYAHGYSDVRLPGGSHDAQDVRKKRARFWKKVSRKTQAQVLQPGHDTWQAAVQGRRETTIPEGSLNREVFQPGHDTWQAAVQ